MKSLYVSAALACALATPAFAASVDVTNANGTIPNQFLSSNGGLDSNDFHATYGNGVSLFMRARNRTGNEVYSGSTYYLDSYDGTNGKRYNVQFQFTPEAGATTATDYRLVFQIDNDPTVATNFITIDANIIGGWTLDDSYVVDGVTTRGTGTASNPIVPVSFTGSSPSPLPEYVISQSWAWDFGFLLGENPENGEFDIAMSVYSATTNDLLLTNNITAIVGTGAVVPTPAAFGAGLLGLATLALRRNR